MADDRNSRPTGQKVATLPNLAATIFFAVAVGLLVYALFYNP